MWETTGGATSIRLPTSSAGGRAVGGRGTAGVPTGTAAQSAAKPRSTDREKARGRLGTPTSGQFSRWGPAPLRTAQRDHATSIGKKARGRLGTPTSGRHSPPEAGGRRRISQFRDGAPLGARLRGHGSAQARERRPPRSAQAGRHRPPEAGERRGLDCPDGPAAPVPFREGHACRRHACRRHACRHPARRSTT